MNRPIDWSPLAVSDPTPGDPYGVQSLATKARDTADEITQQAAALRRLAGADFWDSQAGEQFSEGAQQLAGELDKVTSRYAVVGQELRSYASTLEDAQATTLSALRDAQDAERRAQADAESSLAGVSEPTPEQVSADRQRQARYEAAIKDIERARRRMQDAVEELDGAARHSANRIRAASNDAIKDGFWDRVKGVIADIAPILKAVANVASWAATAVAIVALGLALTVGAPFALLLTGAVLLAISLLANTALASAGEGSWWAVAVDLVSLATFGVGSAATKIGSQAFKAGVATASRAAARRATSTVLSQHRFGLGLARLGRTIPIPALRRLATSYIGRITTMAADAGRSAASGVLSRSLPKVTVRQILPTLDRANARQIAHLHRLATEFPSVPLGMASTTHRTAVYSAAGSTGVSAVIDALGKSGALDGLKGEVTGGVRLPAQAPVPHP